MKKNNLFIKRSLSCLFAFIMIVVGVKAQDMTSTPLTLEAVEAGTINIVNPNLLTIEYNKNGGGWTSANSNPISISVAAGNQVQLRGDNPTYCTTTDGEKPTQITATNDIYIYGNVMSLISSTGFATLTTLPKVGGDQQYESDNTFAYLFTTSGEYLDPVINTTIRNHPTKDIVLPALNVTRCGYMYMFARCQNLTRAPELPATELGWGCYHQMFCSTAIERAPVLAAATVPHEGYSSMFDQCANLNYVKCLATDISAQGSTGFWLNGVAATGTFVKADGMDDWTVGPQDEWGSIHGIPAGWTVKNASEEVASMTETPLTIEATEDATTVTIKNPLTLSIEYSTNGGTSWTPASDATITISGIGAGSTVQLRGNNAAYSSDGTTANSMRITGDKDYYLYGNMMSLVSSTGFATLTTLTGNYAFARLFRNNSHLKSHATKDLVLPATTLSPNCYRYTFQNCSGLTKAPELPATTMTEGCYFATFIGCTSLTTPPELPSTALAAGCYTGMFANSGLVTPPVLPATELTDRCYYQMFYGCTALTTAPALPALTVPRNGYNQMFYNCSSLTETPALPATTIYGYSYNMMFRGCTGLTASPALPVTTMIDEDGMQGMFYDCTNLVTAGDLAVTTLGSSYSCSWMFHGCTSLTKAPKLPATTLTSYCYNRMFDECTSLVTAPELPATNLAELCYNDMFWNCTALKNAPVLPATKLVPYCYTMMFFGCSSLEKAPDLIAPTLEGNCYEHMFMNCTSLNYVKCLATDLGDETATDGWMTNVPATGTFVKAPGVDWSVKGTTEGTDFDDPSKPCTFVHGIPAGWTVETSPIVYAHLNSDGEGNYWATFYNESAGFTADATTSVYTAKVSSGKEKVELTAVDDKTIPAGNAVVLKSSAATATLTYGVAATGTLADNELLASATDITTLANTYMLTKGTSGVGFYHWTGTDIPANRGYLIISGAGAREFVPIDGMATGISEMSDVRRKTDDAYYDLQGRRVLYPTKGIYVKNGKKIIFK